MMICECLGFPKEVHKGLLLSKLMRFNIFPPISSPLIFLIYPSIHKISEKPVSPLNMSIVWGSRSAQTTPDYSPAPYFCVYCACSPSHRCTKLAMPRIRLDIFCWFSSRFAARHSRPFDNIFGHSVVQCAKIPNLNPNPNSYPSPKCLLLLSVSTHLHFYL